MCTRACVLVSVRACVLVCVCVCNVIMVKIWNRIAWDDIAWDKSRGDTNCGGGQDQQKGEQGERRGEDKEEPNTITDMENWKRCMRRSFASNPRACVISKSINPSFLGGHQASVFPPRSPRSPECSQGQEPTVSNVCLTGKAVLSAAQRPFPRGSFCPSGRTCPSLGKGLA